MIAGHPDESRSRRAIRVLIVTAFDLDAYVYEALLAPTVTRR